MNLFAELFLKIIISIDYIMIILNSYIVDFYYFMVVFEISFRSDTNWNFIGLDR